MEHRHELTDQEWERIKNMFPPEHPREGKRVRPAKADDRRIMNGMLWIAGNGAPWRELPQRYGKWQAIYERFRLRKQQGIFAVSFPPCARTEDPVTFLRSGGNDHDPKHALRNFASI